MKFFKVFMIWSWNNLLVIAETREKYFRYLGDVLYANNSHVLTEVILEGVNVRQTCAEYCLRSPTCYAFEICDQNANLCRLCNNINPVFLGYGTNICSYYQMEHKCERGFYDKRTDSCEIGCGDYDGGSGVYDIVIGGKSMRVWCERKNGEMWTVVQRRVNGFIRFDRNWTEYENGFGNVTAEYWLGNKNINILTSRGYSELRIDVTDYAEESRYVKYTSFYVADSSENYKLTISGYSGNAGDDLSYHNGMMFSTLDKGNNSHCAVLYSRGGWWYNACARVNLNGEYGVHSGSQGLLWFSWKGWDYSLKRSTMIIRKI